MTIDSVTSFHHVYTDKFFTGNFVRRFAVASFVRWANNGPDSSTSFLTAFACTVGLKRSLVSVSLCLSVYTRSNFTTDWPLALLLKLFHTRMGRDHSSLGTENRGSRPMLKIRVMHRLGLARISDAVGLTSTLN